MSNLQPLAVYIHWPFCKSKCPYCDFNSHVRESVDQERWKKALLAELVSLSQAVPGREVTSIFFGGGTPSLMPPETAGALIEQVARLWDVAPNIEITLEANPTSVETGTFKTFKAAGINRVSLGVQSLDAASLKFLGRNHSADEALVAIDSARNIFDRYSFDLIYARPNQTLSEWEKELRAALAYAGKHMSLYQLTIEENTAFHHAYSKQQFALPPDESAEALYVLTEEIMSAHGMPSYEISNYAKQDEASRHNMAYWQGDDYVGVGPGAHGRLTLEKRKRIATQTIKSPERWLEAVEKNGHALEVWQQIEKPQEIEERVMMGLRLAKGISLTRFMAQTGEDLLQYIDPNKQRFFTERGLLEESSTHLCATLSGRLLLNSLLAELLG